MKTYATKAAAQLALDNAPKPNHGFYYISLLDTEVYVIRHRYQYMAGPLSAADKVVNLPDTDIATKDD